MRLAGIATESMADGPGVRFVLFAQGCRHQCPNCHNPETWDEEGGEEFSVQKIQRRIYNMKKKNRGVKFSGGEPFLQAAELAQDAKTAKRKGWDVVTYTGFTYDELAIHTDAGVQALFNNTDILIDGRFEQSLKDTALSFRGSSNQRVINLNATRKSGKIILLEGEIDV